MKRGKPEIVMVVLLVGQRPSEIASLVFVDIAQCHHAVAAAALGMLVGLGMTDEITDRLRAARIAVPRAKLVEHVEKIVIDCGGDAPHGKDLICRGAATPGVIRAAGAVQWHHRLNQLGSPTARHLECHSGSCQLSDSFGQD